MRKVLLSLAGLLLLGVTACSAQAQQVVKPCLPVVSNTSGVNVTSCQDVSASNPIPISGSGAAVAPTNNLSGTVVTWQAFQVIAAASTTRKSFEFVNICSISSNCGASTDFCYLFFASSGSPTFDKAIAIPPGGSYLRSTGTIPSDEISATCDSNNDPFYFSVQ